MTRTQQIALAALIFLLIIGTIMYFFVTWSSTEAKNNATSYLVFFVTLVGFVAAVYQLGETERSIQESFQKPALRLEVLPASGSSGQYNSQKADHLIFYPGSDPAALETYCALRVENSGSKAASKIYLTFILRRKGKSGNEALSRVSVDYIEGEKFYLKPIYFDGDVRGGRQVGCTFRFSDDFVIYTDPYDKPVVAELKLRMKALDFEADYEIHYRIQSYEGNQYLEQAKDKKTGKPLNQIYPIIFERST